MRVGKGFLRNFCHREAIGKSQGCNATALEHGAAHGGHGCRNDHSTQFFGLFKGRLLDGLDLRVGGKGQAFDGGIGKGRTTDKGHACGDRDRLQLRVIERLCLDGHQGFGQNNMLHGAVYECATANIDDIATKIQGGQIKLGRRTVVLDDGDTATGQLGVGPIAIVDHVGHAEIVALSAVIPVLGQIGRQGLGCKVDVQILGAEEGETTDEIHGGRNRNLGQLRAIVESISAKEGYALGNIKTGQALTEAEGKVFNIRQFSITKVDIGQLSHTF